MVFNRPIEQVLTYRVPDRLRRMIQPGQRVRVPLGRGDTLAVGYCVRIETQPPADLDRADQGGGRGPRPPPLDRRQDARADALAGRLLRLLVGPGTRRRGAGGRQEARGDAGRNFLVVPEEIAGRLAGRGDQAQAHAQTDGRAGGPLSRRRAPDRRPTSAGWPSARPCRSGAAKQGWCIRSAGGCPSAAGRPRVEPERAAEGRIDGWIAPRRPIRSPSGEPPSRRLRLSADRRPGGDPGAARAGHRIGGFAPFLIHGVTGSGKTEVYLAAIERVVALGREAIVLVPEISLTPQTIRRFRRRFARVAVLHSHLSDAERHRHWQSIASGEVQVVVGVRSAVFAPARRLGLIVVDEEHESTFKQETTPRYHGRDVAVKRAQMEGMPVLLGSATPSLETWRNAERGRYTRLAMPTRVGGRPMPAVEIIDLRHEKIRGRTERIAPPGNGPGTRGEGGQVILLLNRRGFHTFVLCPRCGDVVKCHACDVAATYHQVAACLDLPHLRRRARLPAGVPLLRRTALHYGGIGTERLEREIQTAFPESWRGGWTPTRCGRPAATSRSWRLSRPARSRSCSARR